MNSIDLAWKIRRHVIDMVHNAKASHIGGALSCADIIAFLYAEVLKYDPANSNWELRDRFILSKGHNGMCLYAALAETGFFSVDLLKTYGMNGSQFSCHVSHKGVPGVELTTGSLGHGAGVACGIALDAKLKKKDYSVYCLVGDGECNEGSIWEMALLAKQYKLDNFTVIIDRNNMQAMGKCEDVIDTEPLGMKWESFGWHVVNVVDGHNHNMLREAFENKCTNKPRVIICKTVKGKGVSFMENQLLWHYRDPQGEFYENAVKEIEALRN